MQRVLERGTWDDWLHIAEGVDVSELRELAPLLKLAPRERNFLRNWIECREHEN
ncbi:MAG: hypothetical protein JXX29_21990 [Deltaproteobacteria bacterium]|nr:hypothetical protein [Deltaproteobacteria bacterium]MBN2674367.1 hypothetical protein [Deltaproteobacteria bacterium]